MLAFRNGQLAHRVKEFHEQYGEVVRVAPNELSYIQPEAIRDIYNRKPNDPSFKSLPKDPIRQPPPKPGAPVTILEALDTDHARIRKAWSYSFSNQALAAQEPLVISYVDKMMAHLKQSVANAPATVDLQQWYSFCTFDVICSLSFGEDFGCLGRGDYHEWVGMLVYSLKAKVQMAACRFYPWLFDLLVKTTPKSSQAGMIKHMKTTSEKVQKRLNTKVDRPDFLQHLQKSKEGLTDKEIELNAMTLIFAGSHTLQTAITGITYFLLRDPKTLNVVTKEIRGAFKAESDINMRSLQGLPMLNAAMQEGIRLASPVPLGLTRFVPEGGSEICGEQVPAGVGGFSLYVGRLVLGDLLTKMHNRPQYHICNGPPILPRRIIADLTSTTQSDGWMTREVKHFGTIAEMPRSYSSKVLATASDRISRRWRCC